MPDVHFKPEQSGEIIELKETGGAAGAAPTGRWKLYFKAGGLYMVDDAGVETLVKAG